MGYHELYVSQSNVFSGFQKPFEEADYVILGVPFDVTSTYRTGARFGPSAIRQASLNIEAYSFRTGVDIEDLKLHDLGDLHVSADTEKTLERLSMSMQDIFVAGKKPVTIGGEHTITLGVLKGIKKKASEMAVVSFDAHLDLRNKYMGLKLSHTTFMRRLNEEAKPAKIIEVGTRAVCKEELAYAKKAGIDFFTIQQIKHNGTEKIVKQLKEKLANCKHVYISIDMDVLDPAYVPAVQNPEPEGLDMHTLFDLLYGTCNNHIVGFDVVEIAPNFDNGVSAIQAAKVIFEILCFSEKQKKRR